MPVLLAPAVVTVPLVTVTPGPTPIAPEAPNGGTNDGTNGPGGGAGTAVVWIAVMPLELLPSVLTAVEVTTTLVVP